MKTLMFVEDDSILMDIYVSHFQEYENLKILQAFDGQRAIEILARVQPDVLVTGIHMPKKSGLGVLEFIQEKKYTFPVIVLTNQADMRYQERAFELGVIEYLIKKDMNMINLQKVLSKYLPDLPARKITTIAIEDLLVPTTIKDTLAHRYFEAERAYPPFFKPNTDYGKVIEEIDRMLHLLPDDPVLLGKKGSSLEALEKYDEALAVYEQALVTYPTFLPNMYNKVFCLERLKQNEECNEYFDEILQHYPYEVKALANKGKILKRLNRLEEAMEYCKKALKLDPNDFSALYNKAEIEEALKKKS